jgi:hypothetical protein
VIRRRKNRSLFGWIGAAALASVGMLAFLAWRNSITEVAPPDEALSRYAEVRGRLAWSDPILRLSQNGVVSRRPPRSDEAVAPPTHLCVLAYRAAEQRLVRATVPFWFVKVKGPAVQYSLRSTGLDLRRLGVTPADLQQYGPSVVLDESRENGDRLLVWTE